MQYRALARFAGVILIVSLVSASAPPPPAPATVAGTVTVFKDPNCGCCKNWIEHLREHAFTVVAKDTSDMGAVKRTAGVPQRLYSCHTAFVDGYVIEGHVPAADIQRLLKEKTKVAGIAVAGMPAGSPGMEVPGRVDRYDVTAFKRDGSTRVFARH
jgi:hypothetical protein